MRGTVAEQWHSEDIAGKKAMLSKAFKAGIPVNIELLNEQVEVLDQLAVEMGFAPIRVATVDAAGMRDLTPAIVSPKYASKYRQRTFSVVVPSACK